MTGAINLNLIFLQEGHLSISIQRMKEYFILDVQEEWIL